MLLAFTGEFDMKIINALITSVKIKLKEVEQITRIQKRVYYIMVECLEGILGSYETTAKANPKVNPFSIFTLSRDADYYYFISGNYVLNEYMDSQKMMIDKINALNAEGKRELFRQCMTDGKINNYSADLALVDIAIKSNNTLEYEFKKVDSNTSFYIFQVKIKVK